jgi:hypothetical protein
MGNSSLEKELLEQEQRYWRAMQAGDGAAAMQLSADSCIVAGAQGVGKLDRATLGKMLGSGSWKLEAFELSNPTVLSLTENVAVLAYKVHEELTVGGQRVSLDAADSSAWVKRDGRWLCALHTESLLGDPFGRDRQGPRSPAP